MESVYEIGTCKVSVGFLQGGVNWGGWGRVGPRSEASLAFDGLACRELVGLPPGKGEDRHAAWPKGGWSGEALGVPKS
jgi:hypothetical protein